MRGLCWWNLQVKDKMEAASEGTAVTVMGRFAYPLTFARIFPRKPASLFVCLVG